MKIYYKLSIDNIHGNNPITTLSIFTKFYFENSVRFLIVYDSKAEQKLKIINY